MCRLCPKRTVQYIRPLKLSIYLNGLRYHYYASTKPIIIFLYGFMGDENVSPPFEKENRGESEIMTLRNDPIPNGGRPKLTC